MKTNIYIYNYLTKGFINFLSKILKKKEIFFLFIIFSFGHNPLPNDLVKIADSLGCEEINDPIFEDPELFEGRSFVYGFIPGYPSLTAIFWCQNKKEKEKIYLVFVEDKKVVDKLEWNGLPGGLNSYFYSKMNLKDFIKMSDKSKGPNILVLPVVDRKNDGVVVVFTKYKGEWYIRILD